MREQRCRLMLITTCVHTLTHSKDDIVGCSDDAITSDAINWLGKKRRKKTKENLSNIFQWKR